MTCNMVQKELTGFIQCELSVKDMMSIHGHLAHCRICLQEKIELCQTLKLVNRFQEFALPHDFNIDINRKIENIKKETKRRSRLLFLKIAAIIILTLGVNFIIHEYYNSFPAVKFTEKMTRPEQIFKTKKTSPLLEETLIRNYIDNYLSKSDDND